MADTAASAARRPGNGATAAGGAPAAGGGGLFENPIIKSLAQAYMVYVAVNFGLRYVPGTQQHATANGIQLPQAPSAKAFEPGAARNLTKPTIKTQEKWISIWPEGSLLDVYAKLSTSEVASPKPESTTTAAVLPEVKWEGLEYKKGWEKTFEAEFDVPKEVQRNGSLWLDVFVTQSNEAKSRQGQFEDGDVLHYRKLLTRYMPYRKPRIAKKLIGGAKPTPEEEAAEALEVEREKNEVVPIISYWHPNVTVELVTGSGTVGVLPDPLMVSIKPVESKKDEKNEKGEGYMYPIVWVNDFWLMKEQMYPINETLSRLPIRIDFKPTTHMKWTIFATLEDSMGKSAEAKGATPGSADAMDAVKRIFVEGNPYMLIATIVCSVLHMIFEFLAFTSDVKHWRNKKDLVGASVRTIITNVVVQAIVLLYLIDQNEETSNVILLTQGMGLLVEAWKITKAVDIAVVAAPQGSLIPYKLKITDKHVLSEEEKKTQEFDRLAFKIVGWVTFPCLAGYTVYSLYYNEHKGWYSFVITTLVSFVYAFGFVQLVPQLIINYKLKSVAHIPMKAMAYKFFGTITDDVAIFVIPQPFFHRLACFRDDVVFVILMVQMYIYRVDPNRANEYGQKLTEDEAKKLLERDAKEITEEKKKQ